MRPGPARRGPRQAIIDRVLERGRLIRLDGPSIRTLHLKLDDALKDESDQDDEVARISGNKWPEFPEPTTCQRSIPPRDRDPSTDHSHRHFALRDRWNAPHASAGHANILKRLLVHSGAFNLAC